MWENRFLPRPGSDFAGFTLHSMSWFRCRGFRKPRTFPFSLTPPTGISLCWSVPTSSCLTGQSSVLTPQSPCWPCLPSGDVQAHTALAPELTPALLCSLIIPSAQELGKGPPVPGQSREWTGGRTWPQGHGNLGPGTHRGSSELQCCSAIT